MGENLVRSTQKANNIIEKIQLIASIVLVQGQYVSIFRDVINKNTTGEFDEKV